MVENAHGESLDSANDEIDRRETGIRIALTLLYLLIAAVLESVLGVIIAFQLLWALITRSAPSQPVRDLANRIVGYYYAIGRYLTYNDSRVPFPFSEFPPARDPGDWRASERESEALGLSDWEGITDRDER